MQPSAFFDPVVRRLRFMPWRRGLQLAWKAVVYAGLSFLCLVVLAWLTLQWGILPHIEDWRPEIERHASRAVGVPVRIGHISVRSSSWIPAVDLRDVVLRDASGAEALRLPRVSAALSPQSLLVLSPRLAQLYIEDARLLVRRDAAGHLHVGGLDLAARATGPLRSSGRATIAPFARARRMPGPRRLCRGVLAPRAELFMRLQPSAFFDPVARRLRFMPWRHGLRLAWQAVVFLGLTLLCLSVLAWLTLQWGILPHIEDWRPAIERHASRAVGV
ncbi:MAG TPA: hypothetical protein VIP05_17670, partial [Burkholderiaceae bacterium]